ncbi:hypothetical protein TNCV_2969471 [Trichonephila clavipes]|nr:hypothetical protein TNCV_2969471 [Trichonephila clavipes]
MFCSGRGKNLFLRVIEKVALQVEEGRQSSNVLASTSVRRVAKHWICALVQLSRDHAKHPPLLSYKLQFVQELLPHDFETRHLFSLQFLARLEVDQNGNLEYPLDRTKPTFIWTVR